jgi:hypothetical protein
MLTGGCHCGQVRYSVTGAATDQSSCHCSICRRTTGAPFVAWLTVQRSAFRLTSGTPRQYASSAKAKRTFCGSCGTQLTFEHTDCLGEVDVTTCSLDDPTALPPQHHIHTSSMLPWIELCDRLPRFTDARDGA